MLKSQLRIFVESFEMFEDKYEITDTELDSFKQTD